MRKKTLSEAAVFHPRAFLAFLLFSSAICLAAFSFEGTRESKSPAAAGEPERYMPVPGGETDDLDEMEQQWTDRLTYPTGRFDPAWVRNAAEQDAQLSRGVPAGLRPGLLTSSPLSLNPNAFTPL